MKWQLFEELGSSRDLFRRSHGRERCLFASRKLPTISWWSVRTKRSWVFYVQILWWCENGLTKEKVLANLTMQNSQANHLFQSILGSKQCTEIFKVSNALTNLCTIQSSSKLHSFEGDKRKSWTLSWGSLADIAEWCCHRKWRQIPPIRQ